jgi:alpha-L-fucosidase
MTRAAAGPEAAAALGRPRRRPVPEWYHDAKLGIFVHWGLAAVPGWAPRTGSILDVLRSDYDNLLPHSPYADWYENAIKFPLSPSARHHAAHYGTAPYADFREAFAVGLARWDPGAWADLFREAGAGYVVFVTKHHDGYCLWPSRERHPKRERWSCARDLVGELADAVRARGLRFGVYYSGGIDWSFEPAPVRDLGEFIASMPSGPDYARYAEAQLRELVERYAPAVLWNDIGWPAPEARLSGLLEDYYRAVPDGVVNDRWLHPGWLGRALRRRPVRALFNLALKEIVRRPGYVPKPVSSRHRDFRTPEYTTFPEIQREKWETTRGLGHSFCYNRNERDEDLISERDLVHLLVDVVSKNGNLLLDVGPRGEDGGVPEIQASRLRSLGRWLQRNGEAVHGTRPWERAEGRTRGGIPIRFTALGTTLYAVLLDTPPGVRIVMEGVRAAPDARVALVGGPALAWVQEADDLRVELPGPLPAAPAHVISIARAAVAAESRGPTS